MHAGRVSGWSPKIFVLALDSHWMCLWSVPVGCPAWLNNKCPSVLKLMGFNHISCVLHQVFRVACCIVRPLRIVEFVVSSICRGTWWHSWLRHCTTHRKVAGSVPDGVGIFQWHNPSGPTMALRLTQPLTGMSTRNISWGIKVVGA